MWAGLAATAGGLETVEQQLSDGGDALPPTAGVNGRDAFVRLILGCVDVEPLTLPVGEVGVVIGVITTDVVSIIAAIGGFKAITFIETRM